MPAKIAVVYYSSTGTIHQIAKAVEAGAQEAGAETRLRRAAETAPREAIDSTPGWAAHLEATKDVPEAAAADLEWADGYAFGSPTRFGNVAAQFKQFVDTLSPQWQSGALAKPATGFTSTQTRHGGAEATLLAMYHSFFHWGAIIVPPGYLDGSIFEHSQNPYGTTVPTGAFEGDVVPDGILTAARFQGRRLAEVTAKLSA